MDFTANCSHALCVGRTVLRHDKAKERAHTFLVIMSLSTAPGLAIRHNWHNQTISDLSDGYGCIWKWGIPSNGYFRRKLMMNKCQPRSKHDIQRWSRWMGGRTRSERTYQRYWGKTNAINLPCGDDVNNWFISIYNNLYIYIFMSMLGMFYFWVHIIIRLLTPIFSWPFCQHPPRIGLRPFKAPHRNFWASKTKQKKKVKAQRSSMKNPLITYPLVN